MVNEKRHRTVIAGLVAAAALAAPVTPPAAIALAETTESGTSQNTIPAVPDDLQAIDKTYDLTNVTTDNAHIQGTTGYYQGLYVDATATGGKFEGRAPGNNDVQINEGTIVSIPLAQDRLGVRLLLSSSSAVTVEIDGREYSTNQWIDLTTEQSEYVSVRFDGQCFLKSIAIDYVSDTITYPGTPTNWSASDKSWDFTAGGNEIQGARGTFDGILVDALTGKFGPRATESNHDTQITNGTILYVPVAEDAAGAIFRIDGSSNDGVKVRVDGTDVDFGQDVIVDASDAKYLKVEFYGPDGATSSSKSAYVTGISVDYLSDDTETEHIVTVGKTDCQYTSINEAVTNSDSSLKDHLVVEIQPDTYEEQVIINKPGVILKNADPTQDVIIAASKYSSNRVDASGNFDPVDEDDLGTDKCATVRVDANGTGFQAYGITFQNNYNVEDHLDKDDQTPAVAFNSKADKINLEDCRFIGRQDTLYLQGSGNRVYLKDCYVEGTVDFVFGDADAFFTGCDLKMVAFPGRTSGYFTAANTKTGNTGFVFYDCTLSADDSLTEVSLGRPWQNLCSYEEKVDETTGRKLYFNIDNTKRNSDSNYANISSAVTFVDCTMPNNLMGDHWSEWKGHADSPEQEMVSITYDASVRFKEVSCTYPNGWVIGSTKLTLGSATNENAASAANQLLSDMNIGGALWTPASFSPIEVPETPIDPNPGTGTTTPGGGAGTTTPSEPSFEPTVEETAHGSTSVSTEAPHAGDTVTITPDPDEGYEVRDVTVTDADGNAVEVTENEDGTWSFEQPEDEVIITVTYGCDGGDHCVSHEFADLDSSQWYHDGVDWAISEGLMSGYGDGSGNFGPADTLSRGQLATVLWRQAGEPEADTSKVSQFVDCDQDAFYAQAVAWCVEQGIFTGFDETHFGPAETMDREQLATVLWRQAGSPEVSADLSGYPDASDVAAFAQDAMNWAVQTGALSGQGSTGELDPLGSLERGQAATILMRLAEK